MGLAFVCDKCDDSNTETVLRFCRTCDQSFIAGYSCLNDDCLNEDISKLGEEMGHTPHQAAS
jgi:hypothetical protein